MFSQFSSKFSSRSHKDGQITLLTSITLGFTAWDRGHNHYDNFHFRISWGVLRQITLLLFTHPHTLFLLCLSIVCFFTIIIAKWLNNTINSSANVFDVYEGPWDDMRLTVNHWLIPKCFSFFHWSHVIKDELVCKPKHGLRIS